MTLILLLQYSQKSLYHTRIDDIVTFQLHFCCTDYTKVKGRIIYRIAAGLADYCNHCLCYIGLVHMGTMMLFVWGSTAKSLDHSVILPADINIWLQAGSLCPQSSHWSQTRLVPLEASCCQKHVHCRSNGTLITSSIYLVLSEVTNIMFIHEVGKAVMISEMGKPKYNADRT